MKGNPSCTWCHGSGYTLDKDGECVEPCLEHPRDRRLPEFAAMRKLIDERLAAVRERVDALDRERIAENARLRDVIVTLSRENDMLAEEKRRLLFIAKDMGVRLDEAARRLSMREPSPFGCGQSRRESNYEDQRVIGGEGNHKLSTAATSAPAIDKRDDDEGAAVESTH